MGKQGRSTTYFCPAVLLYWGVSILSKPIVPTKSRLIARYASSPVLKVNPPYPPATTALATNDGFALSKSMFNQNALARVWHKALDGLLWLGLFSRLKPIYGRYIVRFLDDLRSNKPTLASTRYYTNKSRCPCRLLVSSSSPFARGLLWKVDESRVPL